MEETKPDTTRQNWLDAMLRAYEDNKPDVTAQIIAGHILSKHRLVNPDLLADLVRALKAAEQHGEAAILAEPEAPEEPL
jgi:hypothetical protein